MGAQPTAQQRPEPFHCVHMDFTQAIAIFISSELASSVVHTLMTVSPGLQTSINVVLICINQCAWINRVFDQRLDGLLLHIREQIDHDLTATLNHPTDRGSFLLHRASATFTFASASTTFAALLLHYFWLSLMARHHIGFITLYLVGEDHGWLFFTMPPRNSVVI